MQPNPAECSSQIKNTESSPRQSLNQNIQPKIWSQITSSRVKQTRQVIEISEEKAYENAGQSTLSSIQKVKQPQTEEYQNKQFFVNNQIFLNDLRQQRQNEKIHQKTWSLFKGQNLTNQSYKKVQLTALDIIKDNISLNKQNAQSIIRSINLLYKKYVIKPNKNILQQNGSPQYDIYKRDLIFGQSSLTSKNLSQSQVSEQNNSEFEHNPFKRNNPGKTYSDNFVSLVQNEQTTSPNDDLESIANSFVSSIRKVKNGIIQHSSYSPTPNKAIIPKAQKYKIQTGNSNNFIQNEIKMPYNMGNKQFQPQQHNAFQSQDQQKSQRFNQQRLIAKTFVKDGYGLNIVRKYMGPDIQGGGYNRAITTIIRQSYKKIEDFLSKQCNIKIRILTSSEFSLIKTPLVHCRNILRAEDLRTFFKFVAISYNFGKLKQGDYPTAEETLNLYNSILRGLNDRKSVKQTSQKPSMSKEMFLS